MEQHSTKKLLLIVVILFAIGAVVWLISKKPPQSQQLPPEQSAERGGDAGGRVAAAVDGIAPGLPEREPSPEDPALIYGVVSQYARAEGNHRILLNLIVFGEESKERAEIFITPAQAYDSDSAEISAASSDWLAGHLTKRDLAAHPPRSGDRVAVLTAISAFQRKALSEPLGLRQDAEKRVIFLPQR